MIDPDCKVCLGIGWVCENHPQRAWTDELGCQCGAGMTPCDPMAIAVDWLDAYRAARINQIVGMYSPDSVIECACGGRKIIHGQEGIAAYWRDRFIEIRALELEDLRVDRGAVIISYRTRCGVVQALLDIAEDGMITRCRCGPVR